MSLRGSCVYIFDRIGLYLYIGVDVFSFLLTGVSERESDILYIVVKMER